MRGHGDIKVFWLGDYVLNRPADPLHCATDHLYARTGINNDFWDVLSFNLPITGRHHFMGAREVGPQLQAPQATICPTFRHLLVDYSAAGGHPLHVASADSPLIPHAITVRDHSFQNVGYGFDSAVRVPRKPWQIF
jgi:hypothetical protein